MFQKEIRSYDEVMIITKAAGSPRRMVRGDSGGWEAMKSGGLEEMSISASVSPSEQWDRVPRVE